MGFFGHSGGDAGHPMLNLVNFGLRVCQFLLAIATLGLYANDIQVDNSMNHGHDTSKAVTAVVVSCLSLVTAAIFAILPFITADFFHVAVCFVWDSILFCIWCAVFAFFHNIFQYPVDQVTDDAGQAVNKDWWTRNQAAMWVDLVCLLLWLATTILGIFGLWAGRRGRRVRTV